MAAWSEARGSLAKRKSDCHDLLVEYKTGASTKHRVLIHLIFCPKYHRRVLRGKVATRLYELFRQCCLMNDWQIKEINIQTTHIHLLLQINPRDSIAHVMHYIKGGSSRVIRKEFPELEEFLWGDSFWSDGYFAESVGKTNELVITSYIKNQREKQIMT